MKHKDTKRVVRLIGLSSYQTLTNWIEKFGEKKDDILGTDDIEIFSAVRGIGKVFVHSR